MASFHFFVELLVRSGDPIPSTVAGRVMKNVQGPDMGFAGFMACEIALLAECLNVETGKIQAKFIERPDVNSWGSVSDLRRADRAVSVLRAFPLDNMEVGLLEKYMPTLDNLKETRIMKIIKGKNWELIEEEKAL